MRINLEIIFPSMMAWCPGPEAALTNHNAPHAILHLWDDVFLSVLSQPGYGYDKITKELIAVVMPSFLRCINSTKSFPARIVNFTKVLPVCLTMIKCEAESFNRTNEWLLLEWQKKKRIKVLEWPSQGCDLDLKCCCKTSRGLLLSDFHANCKAPL